jgi:hypothetical protein
MAIYNRTIYWLCVASRHRMYPSINVPVIYCLLRCSYVFCEILNSITKELCYTMELWVKTEPNDLQWQQVHVPVTSLNGKYCGNSANGSTISHILPCRMNTKFYCSKSLTVKSFNQQWIIRVIFKIVHQSNCLYQTVKNRVPVYSQLNWCRV